MSRQGTLLVAGFNPSLRIEKGALAVRLGPGHEARIGRVNRPPLRRLIILGSSGWWSFEVPSWLAATGASWAHISRKGTVLGTGPATISPDLAVLRKAQALCADEPVGLRVTQTLIGEKLIAQRRLVADRFPRCEVAIAALDDAVKQVAKADSSEAIRGMEARAAVAYWSAWAASKVEITFPRKEQSRIPGHWRRFDARTSALTGSNRAATTPINALLNITYSLLLVETTIAMRSVGLDPSLPVGMHAPQRNRSNGSLDLMEPVRAIADEIVLDLLASGPLPRRAFVEQADGTVQVASSLVRSLLDAMPILARSVAPHAERVAAMLAEDAGLGRQATRLTQNHRSAGRAVQRKGEREQPKPRRVTVTPACISCGLVLGSRTRSLCDECLEEHESEKLTQLIAAGPASLARSRAEGNDPARTPEALAKQLKTRALTLEADFAWNARHRGETRDRAEFLAEIVPLISQVPLRKIMEVTGLSEPHCAQIRRGAKTPHPRHWESLRYLARPT